MAVDPRTFLTYNVVSCDKGQKEQQTIDTQKKDFFSSLGKVGDLEILNDIGFGKVSEGLRVLAKTSDSIRTGNVSAASLPSDSQGAQYVYDHVGISSTAAQQAASFNPGVANRAYGQAQSIFQQVKQGNFQVSDIPGVFTDLQNLSTLTAGIFTEPKSDKRKFEACGASPYAVDLISRAPKYKFLFVVQFEFTEPYSSFSNIDAAFVVKNSTRPNITFEYEDVNMYGYWSKVPKRTVYEPMTMKFYDDNWNQAMMLYNAYLQAMSPIANINFDQKMEDVRGVIEHRSLDYSYMNMGENYGASSHSYAASYGPTAGKEVMNIFKRITLFHVYQSGQLMNVYSFHNPKIMTLELDDLDMADNGNGNEVSFQFAYDSVSIETGYDVSDTTKYNLEELSKGTLGSSYPLHYVGDPTPNVKDPGQPTAQNQKATLTSKLQSAAQSVTGAISNTINQGAAYVEAGQTRVSNAFSSANEYLGSHFL